MTNYRERRTTNTTCQQLSLLFSVCRSGYGGGLVAAVTAANSGGGHGGISRTNVGCRRARGTLLTSREKSRRERIPSVRPYAILFKTFSECTAIAVGTLSARTNDTSYITPSLSVQPPPARPPAGERERESVFERARGRGASDDGDGFCRETFAGTAQQIPSGRVESIPCNFHLKHIISLFKAACKFRSD